MFIVLLTLAENRENAPQFLDEHKAWLRRGFTDGVFLVAGGIKPSRGGAIIAHGETMEALTARVAQDPFVIEKVAEAEIIEIGPAFADDRLQFLLDED